MSDPNKQVMELTSTFALFCRLNRGIVFNVFLSPQSLLMHEDRSLTRVISLTRLLYAIMGGIFITLVTLFTAHLNIFWFVKAAECVLSVNFQKVF